MVCVPGVAINTTVPISRNVPAKISRKTDTSIGATSGKVIWTNATIGSGRGVAYGDGRIYVARDVRVVALDAKTGQPVASFGQAGTSHAMTEALSDLDGVGQIAWVPAFPVELQDRERFADLVAAAAKAAGREWAPLVVDAN